MDKTDKAVATVTDKLGEKALEYLKAFEELTRQYAPDVVNAALAVVQIKAVGNLLVALGICIAIWAFWKIALKPLKKLADDYNSSADILGILGLIAGGVGSGIGAIIVCLVVFDVWVYVALFNPKLYIAYLIFGKLF